MGASKRGFAVMGSLIAVGNFCAMGIAYWFYWAVKPKEVLTRYANEEERKQVFAYLAHGYDAMHDERDKISNFAKFRKALFGKAAGHVLELHSGTCRNIPYLMPSMVKSLTLIDFCKEMHDVAKHKLATTVAPPYPVLLVDANSAALPYDDDSFDTVMGCYVIATAEDPQATLMELQRVCKPNGRVLLLDAGNFNNPFGRIWAYMMGLSNHVRSSWELGVFPEREPIKEVERSGLVVKQALVKNLGCSYIITANVPFDKRRKRTHTPSTEASTDTNTSSSTSSEQPLNVGQPATESSTASVDKQQALADAMPLPWDHRAIYHTYTPPSFEEGRVTPGTTAARRAARANRVG
eukprot:GDKI01008098.1.p1 GENE.GDKI01008098.1~~GDKI01008098.1.p1  ORF type:complete len:374 (-),score=101.70 GDKI01008098.1:196-1248(-)